MRWIRRVTVLLAAMSLVSTARGAATPESLALPETDPGRHAREYFPAFNADEAAMRAFVLAHVSSEDLARRPVEARLDAWRQMRDELGRVTPVRVTASGSDFIEILVRGDAGSAARIRLLCRADAPHTLQAIRVEDAEEGEDAGAAPVAPTGQPLDESAIVAGLAAEVDSLVTAGAFSGTVLLDKGGKALFSRAAGMASREGQRPNRIDTRFDLGSINKIFTHVALLQLESQGKLSLDDTLDRYLPDYPKRNGRRITLRMLIEHRAGVPDMLEVPALWQDPARVRTIANWYHLIRDADLRFEPGTKQEYSNGGYVLLGAVIERVSGEDYYRYIHDHIYAPAGMTASESDRLEDHRDNTATPYSRRVHGASGSAGAREAVANPKRLGRGSSAGGGYSTAGDLVRFAQALREGVLLDAQHRNRIIGENAGLGIAGGSPGVNALLLVEGPYTLVVLANLDPPTAERFMRTTGRQLARRVGGARGPRKVVRAGGGH